METSSLIDCVLDFETYYDKDYSLRKLENAQYVLSPMFESMGFSIKLGHAPTQFITGDFDTQKKALSTIPWDKVRAVSHNARFDGAILEWRFGFKPAAYLCTMVGSRPHFVPKTGSASLDSIGQHLKLRAKGNYVSKMEGRHQADLTAAEWAGYGEYCKGDTEIAHGIMQELNDILPAEEQELIDLTLKKYLRPKLLLDRPKLMARMVELETERGAVLRHIESTYGVTQKQLASRPQFAEVLTKLGVTIPMKTKVRKNGEEYQTYAFAKDDVGMKDLLINDSKAVRELCQAKLMVSSSLEQSRVARLIDLCDTTGGYLPVPMVYYGAHTGRFSGDEKINLQNLPRVEWKDGALKKGHLRYALVAPEGYEVVAADFSNIEARIVATLSKSWDLVKGFRNGEDIYSWFATLIYGFAVNKKDHPVERFVGKTCILGLGYGMGWKKFLIKMIESGIDMNQAEAQRIVKLYRDTFPNIPKLWRYLDSLAGKYLIGPTGMFAWNEMIFSRERITLPNGMPMQYPDIASGPEGLYFRSRKFKSLSENGELENLTYETGNKIWGGTFLENICQALARIIATRAEARLAGMGLPAAMQVHDELVWCVPKILVGKVLQAIEFEMTRQVDWLPELPIAVEIKHGPSYGDAK
jgi:hypothetical protein